MRLRDQTSDLLKSTQLFSLQVDLNPVPAGRPRVTRWGVYYGKRYTAWRKDAHALVPEGQLNWAGPLFVITEHVVQRPKTTKLASPAPDVDNFVKGTLDLLTHQGGYWIDDKQVICLVASKRWTTGDESPHTLIELYDPHG